MHKVSVRVFVCLSAIEICIAARNGLKHSMAAEGSPGDNRRGHLLPPSQTAEDRGSIILAVVLQGLPGQFSTATQPSGHVNLKLMHASLIIKHVLPIWWLTASNIDK